MTDDLVAFLRACLDEDEVAARDAHYDGQRWLSEVRAKRRIIDLLRETAPHSVISGQVEREDFRNGWQFAVLDALRALALPYAGRDGWRAEWAPDEEVTP